MKKRLPTPDLLVSVESRKGGVGKTTAALCLARLLREKGYAVLFLDLDVTGTNAADIAESPFWKKDLHVIQEDSEKDSSKRPANLIRLFDEGFMAGKAIPDFSIHDAISKAWCIDPDKVNVLGSQIYQDDDDDKKNSKKNGKTTCIERPGILFDDLHTIWLLELVQQLSNNFARLEHSKKRTVVILDNSPGYVGIAPAINEWLTDRGPECGKFLIVTSLDTQDLHVCKGAVGVLHDLYQVKWKTSRQFIEAGKKESDFRVLPEQEAFFMRLASSPASNSQDVDPLVYYKDTSDTTSKRAQKGGQDFCDHPGGYIAAIINRVPRAIKSGRLFYDEPSFMRTKEGAFSRLFGGSCDSATWREWMVSYDEYIENQFLLSSLRRSRRRQKPQLHRLIEALEIAEHELRAGIPDSDVDRIQQGDMDSRHHVRLREQLIRANDIVRHARSAVADAGLEHLARLIRDEWLPGSIVSDFRSALARLLRESEFPYFEMAPFEFDTGPVNPEAREFVEELKKRMLMVLRHSEKPRPGWIEKRVVDMMASALSMLASLSLMSPLWHSPLEEEITRLFAGVLAIGLKHWERRVKEGRPNVSIQRFLAQESVTPGDLHEDREVFRFFLILRSRMGKEGEAAIVDFYSACTAAQARLIDLGADSAFLLQLLRFILEQEMKKEDLFPFVKGIAEDVIVRKTAIHDKALEQMAKKMQAAEYFGEFDQVLTGILKTWGVTNG